MQIYIYRNRHYSKNKHTRMMKKIQSIYDQFNIISQIDIKDIYLEEKSNYRSVFVFDDKFRLIVRKDQYNTVFASIYRIDGTGDSPCIADNTLENDRYIDSICDAHGVIELIIYWLSIVKNAIVIPDVPPWKLLVDQYEIDESHDAYNEMYSSFDFGIAWKKLVNAIEAQSTLSGINERIWVQLCFTFNTPNKIMEIMTKPEMPLCATIVQLISEFPHFGRLELDYYLPKLHIGSLGYVGQQIYGKNVISSLEFMDKFSNENPELVESILSDMH